MLCFRNGARVFVVPLEDHLVEQQGGDVKSESDLCFLLIKEWIQIT